MLSIVNDEDLSKKACGYVRENSFRKGAPNLTSRSFCNWVNDMLLPNNTLAAGAPRSISVEVARHWLHDMGFEVKNNYQGYLL